MLLKTISVGVDTSNVAAKKDSVVLKAEVDKLDVAELVQVPIGFNDIKTKEGDLGVSKLKTIPMDLTKLSNKVRKDVVKNTKFN